MRGNEIDVTKLNTQLTGTLLDKHGNTLKKFDQVGRVGDVVTIGELLDAAGLTLEGNQYLILLHNNLS